MNYRKDVRDETNSTVFPKVFVLLLCALVCQIKYDLVRYELTMVAYNNNNKNINNKLSLN